MQSRILINVQCLRLCVEVGSFCRVVWSRRKIRGSYMSVRRRLGKYITVQPWHEAPRAVGKHQEGCARPHGARPCSAVRSNDRGLAQGLAMFHFYFKSHVHAYIGMFVYNCTCVCVYITRLHVCITPNTHTYTRIYIYTHVCAYVQIYIFGQVA